MPLQTSAESPGPVRTALRLVGDWVGRLGRIWVEGQIAELTKRGSTAFLTLRDPVAAVSVRVICARDGARRGGPAARPRAPAWWCGPSPSSTWPGARSRWPRWRSGPWASVSCWPGWSGCAAHWPPKGCSRRNASGRLPFLPGCIGLICGRDSAAERDVQQNAARRWPAVRFRVEQVAVQGAFAVAEVTDALHAPGRRPRRGCDHHRPGRRVDRGPAAVLRRDAGPRGGRLPDPGGQRDRPRAGHPAARPGRRRPGLHADRRGPAGGAGRDRAAWPRSPSCAPARTGSSRAGWTGNAPGWTPCDPARCWPIRYATSTGGRSR